MHAKMRGHELQGSCEGSVSDRFGKNSEILNSTF